MIKKVKIRDMTEEQCDKFVHGECRNTFPCCKDCPLCFANCAMLSGGTFYHHKDMFSDKVLDQEVEVEVEVPDILTKDEKEWLKTTIKMLPSEINYLRVIRVYFQRYIFFNDYKCNCCTRLPINDDLFKGMEEDKEYTLEELGL